MFFKRVTHIKAPEFPPHMQWLNGKRMPLKSLKGEVVFIYFWTFASAHCLRTLPHIKALEQRYKNEPVRFIGVHTGEFGFERDADNVEKALKREGITHPTILDPKFKLWNLYANRWWPRQYIIDHHGYMVYDHVGEGGYDSTELALQKALVGAGRGELPYVEDQSALAGATYYRTTEEQYLGFLRGRFGNAERTLPNDEQAFLLPRQLQADIVYLSGHWLSTKEAIVHDRKLSGSKDSVVIRYHAFTADAVMERMGREVPVLEVTLDGKSIPQDMMGKDLVLHEGRTVCEVRESRLYSLVNSSIYHGGTLKIATSSRGLAIYVLSFGGAPGIV